MTDNAAAWVPEHNVDPWIRFDMWAELAHQQVEKAIAVQESVGGDDSEQPSPLAQVYMWGADCYAVLAAAATAEADPPSTQVNIGPVTSEADTPD